MEGTWVNCSCFYPMASWDKLFLELTNVLKNIEGIRTFDIEMNSEFGENVRLSLLVPKTFHREAITFLDKRMTRFFESNSILSTRDMQNMSEVPFPTSIIQFDLYDKHSYASDRYINAGTLDKHHDLSNCIMVALQDVEVSYDTIAGLSCYLQLSLFQVCLNFAKIDVLVEAFSGILQHRGFEGLINDSRRNKMSDLYTELSNDVHLKDNYEWVYAWKSKLTKELCLLIENVPLGDRDRFIQQFSKTHRFWIISKLNVNITLTQVTQYLLGDFVKNCLGSQ